MRGITWLVAAALNGLIDLLGGVAGSGLRWATLRGWVYFPFLSQALSQIPFSIGWKLRRGIYARILPSVGQDVVIHGGVVLEDPRTCFGDDVWISAGCYLDYANFADHVLVGPHVVILAGRRVHRSERLDVPIKLQGNLPKTPISIGRGCWIGANATVMADVGADAIVGAGSVVTKPVPHFAVVAGNPARIIRWRGASGQP